MANTIKIKRGSGSDPAASDMVLGEPVLRTDTAELFFKKDDGSVAKVSGGGGGPDFKYLALRNAANNGAASYPNADFTLVTSGTTTAITPAAANTLLVSVNGVIQKPNTGTSTPSQGFALSGSTIKFGANISAAPDFILYQESGGIGEPSDETVSEEKLKVSNSPVNGYFLSAQSGNTGGLTWAAPVATSCTGNSATATALATARAINGVNFDGTAAITVTAAAGTLTGTTLNSSVVTSSLTSLGDLAGLTVTGTSEFTANVKFDGATAGKDITFLRSSNILRFQDNTVLSLGDADDFKAFHNGTDTRLVNIGGGTLKYESDNHEFKDKDNGDVMMKLLHDGAVELYHNNLLRFQTTTDGCQLQSNTTDAVFSLRSTAQDGAPVLQFLSDDFDDTADAWRLRADGGGTAFGIQNYASGSWENNIVAKENDGVELYYDNSKILETETWGVMVTGTVEADQYNLQDSDGTTQQIRIGASGDLRLYHTGSDSVINQTSQHDLEILHNAETMAKFVPDGAVELYYDNGRKFSTTAGGLEFFGRSVDCQVNWNNSSNGQRYGGVYGYLESGVPIMSFLKSNGSYSFVVNDNGVVRTYGTVRPNANNSYDLGTTSHRWANIYSTGLNVSGGTTPATITHTGGNALTLSRSSKNLNFNANYGAANTHATIDVTSGMELRFQVAGSDRVKLDSSGHWLPTTNNARDLGSTSLRWRNVYTNDLNLSNEGGSNDVDGTWGSYTIQEGAEDLFLVNKRNGKKYKFNLTEVS